ncbi:MAG: S9 family peptidase [Alphaproteobacteria bacterium]|nr:S9 family peptidase [Alphaproteobacteria bacterium]
MKFIIFTAAAALALVPPAGAVRAQAAAQAAADPAALFGAREGVQQISLSPSGTKVAFLAPKPRGQGNVLYVVDAVAGGQPKVVMNSSGDPERLTSCHWLSEQRLACNVYLLVKGATDLLPATRLVAIDADGANLKLLSSPMRWDDLAVSLGGGEVIDWSTGDDGSVLVGRYFVPSEHLGSHMADARNGFGVDRLDTVKLSARAVEPPKPNAAEYISDGRGNVRIMGIAKMVGEGQDTGLVDYYYRAKGSRDWKKLGTYDSTRAEGFNPYAVDPDSDVAYGLKKKDGRLAAYSLALDGSGAETLLFAHPAVDVDGFVRIGRNRRVVGVSYSTDKRQNLYFDPKLRALATALSKALPNLPLVAFVDSSADESKLLLWAGSDTDPGRYYLFDKAKGQLGELMLSRPELENAKLAAVRHVTYKAGDGTDIPAYLTLPPGSEGKKLPAIVMPHGGPAARDEWGFDWLSQYFAARGYAVLQPEFRGSSGYGDGWFQKNGFQSWRTAIGDVDDAGRWLVAQGIADPDKLAIVGWSYGGYAALQANVLDPKLFKAAVAIAPVTDLAMRKAEWANFSIHRIVSDEVGSGPHVREGSPAANAERIAAPVLLFHGDTDRNVGVQQSRLMAERLRSAGKSVELVVYPKLDHQLDDAEARADLLRKADAFLRASLKLP